MRHVQRHIGSKIWEALDAFRVVVIERADGAVVALEAKGLSAFQVGVRVLRRAQLGLLA